MKCSEIFFIMSWIKLITASHLLPNEKIVRVRTPEEANGKPYFLDFIGLAEKYGYHAEQHFVTTEDGYILEIFRISWSSSSPKADEKPVALLQHGLGSSSDAWGLFNRSLAYFLADKGYDVWVGNCRGNTYARSHETLSPEEPFFWNFTWHEIGTMDYSATIDYVLNVTNKSTLTLIGHSMGGTCTVVLLSERPEYNKKINMAVLLAPSAYWKKIDPMRLFMLSTIYAFKDIIDPTGMSEFFPQSTLPFKLLNDICKKLNILDICLGLTLGYDRKQIQESDVSSAIHSFPAGASTKSIWHYCQCVQSLGKFRKYDYGTENFHYYGQKDPADYKVSNIITNMTIFYASNDALCSKEDIVELVNHLSIQPIVVNLKYQQFTHFDFALAKDIKTLLHDDLLQIISKYKDTQTVIPKRG